MHWKIGYYSVLLFGWIFSKSYWNLVNNKKVAMVIFSPHVAQGQVFYYGEDEICNFSSSKEHLGHDIYICGYLPRKWSNFSTVDIYK